MSPGGALKVLVVDDDPQVLEVVAAYLRTQGHDVTVAEDGEAGWARVASEPPDVLVTDVKMPGLDGITLLTRARELYPELLVLVISGLGTIHDAVTAMREGADDYITKPFSGSQLALALDRARQANGLREENRRLRRVLRERPSFGGMLGCSASIQAVFERMEKVGPVDSTVLITGESGVGKELVVEALHAAHPRRSKGPLVSVHCGAIPDTLIESELFGHLKGAYTSADRDRAGRFEQAHGGTLFLDEISTMRLDVQAKLLRVLQTRRVSRLGGGSPVEIDVRVIAASNENLREKVREGSFRQDLFYRLHVIPIVLPPLRERRSDIPLLAGHFLHRALERLGWKEKRLSQESQRLLADHSWPGNVRELENAIEFAAVMAGPARQIIEPEDFPAELRDDRLPHGFGIHLTQDGLSFDSVVSKVEKELILQSLSLTGGNKARAAELLDLKRTTFVEKLKRMRQADPDFVAAS